MLSFVFSTLTPIFLILIAFFMIIIEIVKSKLDDDRKKKKGLKISPIKLLPNINNYNYNDNENNNNYNDNDNENVDININLGQKFDSEESPIAIRNNREVIHEDYDDLERHWDREVINLGLDENDFKLLMNNNNYDDDDDDDEENDFIKNDSFFNRFMNTKQSKTSQKNDNTELINSKKKIEKINKETQERLQALERERITNIRLMKMKTDEERKSFLREIEKEEENKRNREKKIHELTVKIKKIMGSIAKESKDVDEKKFTLDPSKPLNVSEKKQLDSIQMEELYAEAQSMMRETVSEEFKDLFAEFDTFYRKIESILNKLRDFRKILQSKSGKNFQDINSAGDLLTSSKNSALQELLKHFDISMKQEVLKMFEEHNTLIMTRLLLEPVVAHFIKLLCESMFNRLKDFRKSIEDNSGKTFKELDPSDNYKLEDSISKKILRTLCAQFDEEMKDEVQHLFDQHKIFMRFLKQDPLVLIFEKLLKNPRTGLHIESTKIRIHIPEELNECIENIGNDIKNFTEKIKNSANENGKEEEVIFDTVLRIEKVVITANNNFLNEPLGYIKVLLKLLEYTFGAVKDCKDFEDIPVFTFIIYGIFNSMNKQIVPRESKRVLELFKSHSDLICKPFLSEEVKTPNLLEFDRSNDRKQNENVAVFYGLLIASNSQFPLNIVDGYSYVVTCGKALSRYIIHSTSDESVKIENAKHFCTALTISLRTFGRNLKIQVPKYKELLDTIETSIKAPLQLDRTEEGQCLISAIALVNTGESNTSKFINFKNQEPVIMKKSLIMYECNSTKIQEKVEKFKEDATFKKVKKDTFGVTGLLNKFNSINDVLAGIGIRSQIKRDILDNDAIKKNRLFQDYAHDCIVKSIFTKIEGAQFTRDDPKNVFRYAFLIKSLSGNYNLKMMFKSYFYNKCKLTIPVLPADIDPESMEAALNVVSVYAVIIGYCDAPCNIQEGWNLLAAIINYYSDPNIVITPSNYVISVLDILIGITGETLYENIKYKNRLIKYLELLQKVIVDKQLTSNKQPRVDALKEKINDIMNKNNGQNISLKDLGFKGKHDVHDVVKDLIEIIKQKL